VWVKLSKGERSQLLAAVDKAIARITKGHTKGVYARDADGHGLRIGSHNIDEKASSFCIIGAFSGPGVLSFGLRVEIQHIVGQKIPIVSWNDAPERTQADVLAVLATLRERVKDAEEED
jgi:hypothetical protein